MERSRKIFHEIASAVDKVITSANNYADHKDSWGVGHSHFQLEGEMRRVSVALTCIADILAKSVVPGGPEFDVRLQDWLATDGPEQCRDTLIRMEELLQVRKDNSSWVSKIFQRGGDNAPAGDRIKEAVEHFISRKGFFYFLSVTEIWNNEENAHQQRVNAQQESDVLAPGSSIAIRTEINSIMVDSALHQGEHADHILREGSNDLDQSSLVPIQIDPNNTIPDTDIHRHRHAVSQSGHDIPDEQPMKEKDAKKRTEIVNWLDGLNCAEKQDDTLVLRQPDTCNWLFDTARYKTWRDGGNSFLWLRGKPGAGKSVLASSVIHSLETSLRQGETLAFFYCDFRSEQSTSSAEVLRSILSQLLRGFRGSNINPRSLLEEIVKAKERGGSTRNNAKELATFTSRVARLSSKEPLVIIDALDECKDVRVLLQALMVMKDHVRLFVTSRPLHVVTGDLSDLPFISMDDMEDELSADIELHVIRELDARHRLRELNAGFKAEIRSVLCKKAGGMFRWIQCSIDTLDRCVTLKEVRSALDSLPEGLEETYERILRAINRNHREGQLAQRALTWLVAALRPLRLSELVEGLSINLQTQTLDRYFGPMHDGALLDVCGSLVTHSEKTGIIILSHFSVKEYLMGKLILTKLPQYYINWECAHSELARSCMCYLSIYLKSPPGNSSNVPADTTGISSQRRDHVRSMSQPLRDYVVYNAVNHFQHLGVQFGVVLHAIEALARDVRQHPRMWNNLCRYARRDVGSATPSWPTSKHDLILYILVTYAPNSLLRTFFRRTPLKPKEGTNPLIYAAYFNKEDHARTLLSRGGRLNRRGWDVDGFFQVLPIEVALQTRHYTMVTLFVQEGGTVPPCIFTNTFFQSHRLHIPSSIARKLLQTDDFAEAVNNPLNDVVSRPMDVFDCLLETEDTYEHDFIGALRRFIQVVNNDIAHNADGETFLRDVAVTREHIPIARCLLSLGISLPSFGTLSRRGIRITAPIVQFLVENGANVHHDAHTVVGGSVLHTVLQSSWEEGIALEATKALISHGCDPLETSTSSGETPLRIAVKRGFVSLTRYLLSLGVPPSPNLLHVALSYPNKNPTSMIICLLKNGADIHARTIADGDPVLHTALSSFWDESDAFKIAKILVDHGFDPFEESSSGKTLLHIAVKRGFVTVTQYLLSLGIVPSPDLLHIALVLSANKTTASMIISLVENGADVHGRTAIGESVLHTILRSPWEEDNVLETVKTLISHGCDPLEASSSGETTLHIAVKLGLVSVAQYLLSLGIFPSPGLLHTAWGLHNQRKRALMITCLVESRADVHARTNNGESVLHVVLQSSWGEDNALEAAKALIAHDCDPFEASSSGETPLYIAVKRGFVSVAQYLFSLGVPPSSDLLHVASNLQDQRKRTPMIICLVKNGVSLHTRTGNGDYCDVSRIALQSSWDEKNALETVKILVDHDVLEASSPGEKTLLHIAVERGFVSVARYLLSLGVSPSSDLLHTALNLEDQQKRTSMIVNLIENGADVHARNAAGDSVLHTAMQLSWNEDKALEAVRHLVSHGCDPLEANSYGRTPLHIAVECSFVSVARYFLSPGVSPPPDLLHTAWGLDHQRERTSMIICLVESGANVHARTEDGESVLHSILQWSSEDDHALEAAKALISHGCDPFQAGSSGETPLCIAVMRGFVSVARYLLSLGIPPSFDVLYTASELHYWQKRAPMIVCLIENGANVHARTGDGDYVSHIALRSSCSEENALETVKVLVGHGCDARQANSGGKTLLHVAVEQGFVTVARYLFSLGISPSPDLLHVASNLQDQRNRTPMIVCLVENGANIHARTTASGDSVLHTALQSSWNEDNAMETVKILVSHGCNPLKGNSYGKTPLHIAVECGFVSVARYFLSLGAPLSSDLLLAALLSQDEQEQSWILRWLARSGANIHTRTAAEDPRQYVTLSDAHYTSKETLKLLVGQGCNPLEPNSYGEIPLCVAIEQRHVTAARILLSLCAPPGSPCDILGVVLGAKQLLRKLPTVKFLIDQGVTVLAKAEDGDSTLHIAIASVADDEVVQVVMLLLRQGCDPTIPNSRGATPFHIAIERGCLPVVKQFVSLDVPLPPGILFTAIKHLPTSGRYDRLTIFKALVTAGCDTQARNAARQTPLDAAISLGHVDVVDYLLSLEGISGSIPPLAFRTALMSPLDSRCT